MAGALLAGLAQGAGAAPAVQAMNDIDYGPLPGEQGDLYLPDTGGGNVPVVLLIHGGGWVEGARGADSGLARAMAAQGVAVFNIDYRLAKLPDAASHWPAQLLDAQLAVRFLRANAKLWGLDTKRFGAMGDSAGAQLAVFLGVLPRSIEGDVGALYPGQSPSVRAVVDQFGPMNLSGMGPDAAGSVAALFGTAYPAPSALASASPLPSITAQSAPVYIIQGQDDRVVPFWESQVLADALKAHGVAYEFVPYAGGHEYKGVSADEVAALQTNAMKWLVGRLRG